MLSPITSSLSHTAPKLLVASAGILTHSETAWMTAKPENHHSAVLGKTLDDSRA
jgi:hypothetical protein